MHEVGSLPPPAKTILLALMVLAIRQNALAQTVHTVHAEFPPLSMTYKQFAQIIEHSERLVSNKNGGSCKPETYHAESVRVDTIYDEITTDNMSNMAGISSVSYNAIYNFKCTGSVISDVNIFLSDFSRDLKISGASESDANELKAVLAEDFMSYKVLFGGSGPRIIAGSILISLALLYMLGVSFHIFPLFAPLFFASGLVGPLLAFYPWGRVFPGFVLEPSTTDFFQQNAVVINVVGLAASILTIGLAGDQIWRRIFRRPT